MLLLRRRLQKLLADETAPGPLRATAQHLLSEDSELASRQPNEHDYWESRHQAAEDTAYRSDSLARLLSARARSSETSDAARRLSSGAWPFGSHVTSPWYGDPGLIGVRVSKCLSSMFVWNPPAAADILSEHYLKPLTVVVLSSWAASPCHVEPEAVEFITRTRDAASVYLRFCRDSFLHSDRRCANDWQACGCERHSSARTLARPSMCAGYSGSWSDTAANRARMLSDPGCGPGGYCSHASAASHPARSHTDCLDAIEKRQKSVLGRRRNPTGPILDPVSVSLGRHGPVLPTAARGGGEDWSGGDMFPGNAVAAVLGSLLGRGYDGGAGRPAAEHGYPDGTSWAVRAIEETGHESPELVRHAIIATEHTLSTASGALNGISCGRTA